jgi:hypothetical protein
MSRTFQDNDFLVWEAFASGGRNGFSENANLVFYCQTDRSLRARVFRPGGDNADVEAVLSSATADELLELLYKAEEVP